MRWALTIIFSLSLFVSAASADTTGRVIKVLPQYLDTQGRNTVSPSLYERDAYQLQLLHYPELRGGLLFNIQWNASYNNANLKLRVEARGMARDNNTVKICQWDAPVQRHGWFSQWEKLPVSTADFKTLGTLTAWRVSLRDGDRQLSEQHSYLW